MELRRRLRHALLALTALNVAACGLAATLLIWARWRAPTRLTTSQIDATCFGALSVLLFSVVGLVVATVDIVWPSSDGAATRDAGLSTLAAVAALAFHVVATAVSFYALVRFAVTA